MLFRTLNDDYMNLTHYRKFRVMESPVAEGFIVVAELPTHLPTEEEFYFEALYYCESKEEAINFLHQVMYQMALGTMGYSAQKILKDLDIKEK